MPSTTDAFSNVPMAAGVVINPGDYIGKNAAGYFEPMNDSKALQLSGQADTGHDNTSGANGAKTVQMTPLSYADNAALFQCSNPLQSWIAGGNVHMFFLGAGPGFSNQVGLAASSTFKNVAGLCRSIQATGGSGLVLVDTVPGSLANTSTT